MPLSRNKEFKIILLIVAVTLLYLSGYLAKFDWNPSATIILGEKHFARFEQKIGLTLDNLVVFKDRQYDGLYYYGLALDPQCSDLCAGKNAKEVIMRVERVVYPLLAFWLSFGRRALLPMALILINLLALAGSSFLLLRFLEKYRADPRLVYLWGFGVGAILCLTRDLPFLLMFFFILAALFCLDRKKNFLASGLFLLAMLTGEIALSVIAPVVLFLALKKKWRAATIVSLSLVAYAGWQWLLALRFGAAPMFMITGQMTWPLWGFVGFFNDLFQNWDARHLILASGSLLVILFVLFQVYLLLKYWPRTLTLNLTVLLSQILMMLSLGPVLLGGGIDNLGRYAQGLFLFSILYTAEAGEKYSRFLISLTVYLSVTYLSALLLGFNPAYFIS
ncbi:MAG: hypothetical protein NTY66_00240 [Candidatus Vogelbacteria bacterium]|nr:hypothetical protein [Candidatus Vogelbacteria bacterium]